MKSNPVINPTCLSLREQPVAVEVFAATVKIAISARDVAVAATEVIAVAEDYCILTAATLEG